MKNHFGHKDSVIPKPKHLFESSITSDNLSSINQKITYNSATQLSNQLNTKINKSLKRKCPQQPTNNTHNIPNVSETTHEDTDESESSDFVTLKPSKTKKNNIQSEILDLLKEEKKETQENNKQFFNLMERLIGLEEEKLKILKEKSTQ